MKEELVFFKGTKEGVYVYVKDGSFVNVKKELERKLKESLSFFESGEIIDIKGNRLSNMEKNELRHIIEDKYNLEIIEKNNTKEEKVEEGKGKADFFTEIKEGMTKFVNTTLRSGQTLNYDGNIVIIGDVNPGAYVVAMGNIIVLGTLRGIAHAGCNGNKNAVVAAYNLQPTQLRITNIIARRPDNFFKTSKKPEVARIYKGEVLIESYLVKNKV
ncbi:MAG TPA: septum site-determining protein MinC [Tissierellales bacterium]|nr:septum site-determining protein MinC [Tissierellales bacterium]